MQTTSVASFQKNISALLPSGDVRVSEPEPAQRQTAYSHYLIAGVALLAAFVALAYLSAVRKRREQKRRKREEEQREREEQARREREEQERQEREERIKRKVEKLNSAFSGECLGDVFTAEQSAAIRAGTFDGMALGDYWTIDGVNWRIADFDYLICSDKAEIDASKHHVMIVPDKSLYKARMNSSDTTSGGYAASEMRRTGLDRAKGMIKGAFGAEHILADYGVELMTIEMVFGEGDNALSLFRLKTDFRKADEDIWLYWLQDVVSPAVFAAVGTAGHASTNNASYAGGGVRSAFAIF